MHTPHPTGAPGGAELRPLRAESIRALRSRRGRPWLLAFAAAVSAMFPASGAEIRQDYACIEGGGGSATGDSYSLVGSIAAFGGTVATRDHVTLRPGFLGQLNDPPRVAADRLSRSSGLALKKRPSVLLANDADPEGGPLTFVGVQPRSALGGTASSKSGWILYQPPDSSETDRFEYTVEDQEGDRAVGTVWIEVEAASSQASARTLLAVVPIPGGGARLEFIGIRDRGYRIEWSDSLASPQWVTLSRQRADRQGLFTAFDPAGAGARFYRVIAE